MEPLISNKKVKVTENTKTGEKRILESMTQESIRSDQGSIDSVNVVETHFLDCGCEGEVAGRCYECQGLSCKDCHGRCDVCKKPICPEHSKFLPTGNQTVIRLCSACNDKNSRKQRSKKIGGFLLDLFVERERNHE